MIPALRHILGTHTFLARRHGWKDPLDHLLAKLDLSDDDRDAIEREVVELVEGSVEFAKSGTDPKPEDALENIYA